MDKYQSLSSVKHSYLEKFLFNKYNVITEPCFSCLIDDTLSNKSSVQSAHN